VPRYDLVIVGVGSAGLTAAELASSLCLRTAAVEVHRIGGDCLWTGCMPSKTLLASAKVAHHVRTADRFGIAASEPEVDLPAVWRRIRDIQAEIAATDDSPERVAELVTDLVPGRARLTGPHTVDVDGRTLDARYILLATGSRPAVPAIAGLVEAGFLTSENVFELEDPPRSVVVIGGGPVGVELAQGLCRLGVAVTLLQRGPGILARDEPELATALEGVLREEGVALHVDASVSRVTCTDELKRVHAVVAGKDVVVEAEEILVATGRTPGVDGLGLAELGIGIGDAGVKVDDRLRTSVRSVYAVGDLAGRSLFTHSAAHEAAIAVRNMFFPGRSRPSALVPWCTFTDPELASVGVRSAEATERHGAENVEVWYRSLDASDRARTEGATSGGVSLVTVKGRLVGAHVLAPSAGELIQELTLAIHQGMRLRDLASVVHVYPTIASSVHQLAGESAYRLARRYGWLVRRV
jgi:pyruvate/2-oxoglutarate dehydrogenase complex dihydrolipoamide dehydrogenase (E3) component